MENTISTESDDSILPVRNIVDEINDTDGPQKKLGKARVYRYLETCASLLLAKELLIIPVPYVLERAKITFNDLNIS